MNINRKMLVPVVLGLSVLWAQTLPVFQDEFKRELDSSWNWVRETPGARKVGGDGLHLRVLSGTLWAKDNTGSNLMVRPMPAAMDIATEVTVTNDPALMNEQAGLIWYVDDDNYIKLVKEMKEQPYVILGREEQQAAKTFGRIEMPAQSVKLRLTAEKGRVFAHAKSGDSDWQLVGECTPLKAESVRAGIFASVLPGETDRWVRFNDFRITKPIGR